MKFYLLIMCWGAISFAADTSPAPSPEVLAEIKADADGLKLLQKEMDNKLTELTDPVKFKEFIQKNPELFPGVSPKKPSQIVIKREEWKIGDQTFVLSNGYRQLFIEGLNSKFLKELWSTPELFPKIYQLDKSAVIPGFKNTKTHYQARIYKKIPIIADQDYTLDYQVTEKPGSPYFVRARLVKDHGEFALRDNFKSLEETPDGMVITVIDFIYPLSSIVRALGPTVRGTLKDELRKLNELEKCFTEKNTTFPPAEATFALCHELIKLKKQNP